MLNIRAMEEKDIPQVEEIEKKIFSLPWSEKSFHDACSDENNIYLVCEDKAQLPDTADYGRCLVRGILRIWQFILITEKKVSE